MEKGLDFARGVRGVDIKVLRRAIESMDLISELHEMVTQHVDTYNISRSGFLVLMELLYEPEHRSTPAELAKNIEISRASMSATLDKLEQLGFVKRSSHPGDKRKVVIRMAQSGKAFIEQSSSSMLGIFSEVFSKISKSEGETLIEILKKLQTEFERILNESSPEATKGSITNLNK